MVPRTEPLPIDESAGSVAVLREAVGLLPRVRVVLALFVVVAFLTAVANTLGNLAGVVAQALAVVAAYEALGGRPDVSNSAGVRVVLAVVAGLVAGVCILIGLVFLVVPGIYLLVRLRLVVPAVMLEDSGPLEALSRSFALTESHGLTVFGVWLLPTLVGLAIAAGVVVATGGITTGGGSGIDPAALRSSARLAGAAAVLVTGPVTATADAVMYGLWAPAALGGDDG